MEIFMAFSLCVISGIAVISFAFAGLKARHSQKRDVQTIFTASK
jgi:hypothetical protein